MVIKFAIWATFFVATVLASHGTFRSCFECSKQSKNYMCDWGNKEPGKVACCEPGSRSLYCQPRAKNKCSPTFDDSKGMFFTYCPGINKDLCGTESQNLTLRAAPKRETHEIANIRHRNMTDYAAAGFSSLAELKEKQKDIFEACYYVIETPQYLYSSGTVRMEILEQKNVDLMLFSGPSVETAKEGEIVEVVSDDGS